MKCNILDGLCLTTKLRKSCCYQRAFLFKASCYTAIAVQSSLFDTLNILHLHVEMGIVEGKTGANSFQYVAILSNTSQNIWQSCVMINMEQSFSHRSFFVVIISVTSGLSYPWLLQPSCNIFWLWRKNKWRVSLVGLYFPNLFHQQSGCSL